MIPHDNFTPHGYLDNPYHSWKLNPSGVLRSMAPLGMGWHVPNLGSYVNNQFQYTAHLTIGLNINDLVLVTQEDFRRHRCTINSQLHTKNCFEYTCVVPQYELTLTARYFLVQEHVLGCILTLSTTFPVPIPITCYCIHQHVHNPHTSRLWEHGLYALQDRQRGCGMLGLASEGDVFVHGARLSDHPDISNGPMLTWDQMGFATSLDELSAWAKGARIPWPGITQRQSDTGWQHRALALPCRLMLGGSSSSSITLQAALARGVSQDQALLCWLEGMESIKEVENKHREDDEAFWQQAPQLTGDWPAHWRRGLVYDLEMLRMIIRPPDGVVEHPWDGMQIQAPRLVLAEAAMDALFLSYADPELAAEVILGHFESAPRPNLPCMREDGSYNMVADDGQVCGTAPEWGFPLWCCDKIFARTGDLRWLRRLYPGTAAYLRWWLEHRSDDEGWLGYACSWESGQDVSTRFGPQQTGGTIIQHVRPVDLQASVAQGAAIVSRWAALLAEEGDTALDFKAEAKWWHGIANQFADRTQLMWHNGWFRDYDSVAKEWSAEQDAMHLSPVFCGVAVREQIEQLRPALAQPPSNNPHWRPLSWPPIIMTVAEAARSVGMLPEAADLAYRFIDASYSSIDSRAPDEYGNIPGITRENRRAIVSGKWGETDYVNSGIEGYGWGAVSIHLLLRYLLGLCEVEVNKINIAPTLPQALRRSGAIYRIEPLPWGNFLLGIECAVRAGGYTVRIRCQRRGSAKVLETVGNDKIREAEEVHSCEWSGKWGEGRTLLFPQLTLAS